MSDNRPFFRLRRVPKDESPSEPRREPPPETPSVASTEADSQTTGRSTSSGGSEAQAGATRQIESPTAPPTPAADTEALGTEVPPEAPLPTLSTGDASESAGRATGGLFTSPASVLSFLAGVAGARLADEATCRRGPDGEWWADVELSWESAAPLIRTAGGRPFERHAERWLEVPVLDPPSDAWRQTASILEVSDWATVDLADVLGTLPLRRGRGATASSLDVVVSGALGRWVLRRATALGLQVRMATAQCRPLRNEGSGSGVLLMRLEAETGTVPRSLIQALSSLPYTVVGRSIGLELGDDAAEGRLLVDVRYRPPLVETLLGPMIPSGEIWLLAGPDVGHWRLHLTGEVIDGAELLAAAPIRVADAPASPAARLPDPVDVHLMPRPGVGGPTDALLLDDEELAWLQRFLMTRPVGERAFLLPGGTRHLLTAPGGLGASLPFGTPLTRIGPGGLYIESGARFFPPLPPGARREVFALDDTSVVAVTADGDAFRFEREQLVPAWALWLGDTPEVRSEMSAASRDLLLRIAAILQSQQQPMPSPSATRVPPLETQDPSQLLKEAQQAELRGDLTTAAELLEKAGQLGPAGRLYERAAQAS